MLPRHLRITVVAMVSTSELLACSSKIEPAPTSFFGNAQGGEAGFVWGGAGTSGSAGTGTPSGGTGGNAGPDLTVPIRYTDTYDPNCAPTPPDGHHNAEANCNACHFTGNNYGAPVFAVSGTVENAERTPLAHVEVSVDDGTEFVVACSAENGNFWVLAEQNPKLVTSKLIVGVRGSFGEARMNTFAEGRCNKCHYGIRVLEATP